MQQIAEYDVVRETPTAYRIRYYNYSDDRTVKKSKVDVPMEDLNKITATSRERLVKLAIISLDKKIAKYESNVESLKRQRDDLKGLFNPVGEVVQRYLDFKGLSKVDLANRLDMGLNELEVHLKLSKVPQSFAEKIKNILGVVLPSYSK
jgi:ribosome-binding protein aMBF1 (putative translation factor)